MLYLKLRVAPNHLLKLINMQEMKTSVSKTHEIHHLFNQTNLSLNVMPINIPKSYTFLVRDS